MTAMGNMLITGGTGFLGSNLLEELANKYNVTMLKRSFSNLNRLKKIKELHKRKWPR